jgi:broad specificity phosphatase PhoE
MLLPATQLTIELIPHCTSVPREGWAGRHDVRPLAELGMRQAEALVAAIGSDVDGVYSSPAVRCRQTVGPRHVGRGGWYTLRFASGGLAVTSHDPAPSR